MTNAPAALVPLADEAHTVAPQTAAAVFADAKQRTHWTRTTAGLRTEVTYDGYTWTVDIPRDGRAAITHRAGYGGTEFVNTPASWATTVALVDTALRALRA